MSSKKIIITGGSVIGVLLLGAVAYYFFGVFLKSSPSTGVITPPPSASSSNSGNNGPITTMSDVQILAYFLEGDKIIAIESTGEVVEIKNGKTAILSSAGLASIMRASFSFDGKKILVKFGSSNESFFSVFDRGMSTWMGLGVLKIKSADWSPNTNEIAYLQEADRGSNIGIVNTDKLKDPKKPELGFAKTTIANLNELDSEITWLNKNEILVSSRPTRYVSSTVLKYKVKEKTFETTLSNVLGAAIHWDKKSGLGVEYSFVNNKNMVTLLDASGATRGQMGFVTMPEKCSVSGPYLYCGIPTDLRGAVLPDDYLMRAVFFRDNFYRVSLADGKTESLLSDPGHAFDATSIQILDNKMYFLNRLDGRLYGLTMQAK